MRAILLDIVFALSLKSLLDAIRIKHAGYDTYLTIVKHSHAVELAILK